MLTKKKKFRKKEIKEDKLVTFLYKAQNIYDEYKTQVIAAAIIIAAVAIIGYWYIGEQSKANEQAGIQLAKVMKIFDSGSYLEAIEGRQGTDIVGLKKIVEEYGSTDNGETAKIYLADAYSYLGNYDEAFKYYKDYGGSIDLFKASSLAGQAGYYASKNEYKKAADLYLQAASVTEINAQDADYLLNAAINYLNAGEKEEAKALLQKIKKEYRTSQANREANRYLVQLK
ncbi:tetratricopeptide repeat protein [bacterium BMS3Abin03]|nr:tetratricopeptide repeat protein [bacterium BMS3Abin03]